MNMPDGTKAGILEISDLEFLDRLIARGEALLHHKCTFTQAEALLRVGYAEVASTYAEGKLRRIVPTNDGKEMGRARAAYREAERNATAIMPSRKVLLAMESSYGSSSAPITKPVGLLRVWQTQRGS